MGGWHEKSWETGCLSLILMPPPWLAFIPLSKSKCKVSIFLAPVISSIQSLGLLAECLLRHSIFSVSPTPKFSEVAGSRFELMSVFPLGCHLPGARNQDAFEPQSSQLWWKMWFHTFWLWTHLLFSLELKGIPWIFQLNPKEMGPQIIWKNLWAFSLVRTPICSSAFLFKKKKND